MQSAALSPLADYKNDKLAITEEELLSYVASRQDAAARREKMEPLTGTIGSLCPDSWFDKEYGAENQLTLVPLFSRSGGYSAVVTSFAGININTKRPDDAFFMVDYIMSKECQQSKLYAHMTLQHAVPTMEGLLSDRDNRVSEAADDYVYMSESLYKEFETFRESISRVDFYTPLDGELFQLECEIYDEPSKPIEKLVHDTYTRMNMMLAES